MALNKIDCLEHDNIEFNISGGKIQQEQEEEHKSDFQTLISKGIFALDSFTSWVQQMKRGIHVNNNETFGRPLLVLQIAGKSVYSRFKILFQTHDKASNWFLDAPCLSRGRKQIMYYARLFSIDLKVGDMQSQIRPLLYGVLLPKMYEYFWQLNNPMGVLGKLTKVVIKFVKVWYMYFCVFENSS